MGHAKEGATDIKKGCVISSIFMKVIAVVLNVVLLSLLIYILRDWGWPSIDDDAFWYYLLWLASPIVNLMIIISPVVLNRGWFTSKVMSKPMKMTAIALNICLLLYAIHLVVKAVKDDYWGRLVIIAVLLVSSALANLFEIVLRNKAIAGSPSLSEQSQAVEEGDSMKVIAVILNIGLILFLVISMADGGLTWPSINDYLFWFTLLWVICPVVNLIHLLLSVVLKRDWPATKVISKPVKVIAAILNICLLLYTVPFAMGAVRSGYWCKLSFYYALFLSASCTVVNLFTICFPRTTVAGSHLLSKNNH